MQYLVYLHSLGVSHKKLHTIFEHQQNYKEVYNSIGREYLQKWYKKNESIEKIVSQKEVFLEEIIDKKLQEHDVEVITFFDSSYPKLLKELSSPPFFLYIKWVLDDSPKLGVVGSRKMSDYGKKIIEKIVPEIARYFTIVSGGAYGCDSQAHRTTLDVKWKTIAVVGTWIDIIHPAINGQLYREIVDTWWAIISIFPLGTEGSNFTFPIRNEIIAWISSGVLVVEAAEKSGSLITARLALEQSKEVFAVPWDIFKQNSLGCTKIIQKGEAKLVISPQDIFEEFNISFQNSTSQTPILSFEGVEKTVYYQLIWEEKTVDEISKNVEKSVSEVSMSLSMMELKGMIVKNSLGKYQIK